MNYVIGSGPSGVSVAMALLEQGQPVTMIDSGLQLEADRQHALLQLKSLPPNEWKPPSTDFLLEGVHATSQGILLKRAYGSDYPYRVPHPGFGLKLDGADFSPSFAQGGLSTVWGGVVLPHRQEDINDWPISISDLAPHYQAVARFMPIATGEDRLGDLYPLYSDHVQRFRHSPQARRVLSRWDKNSSSLASQNIRYGSSRVAMRAEGANKNDGCVYCGLCMYGCPRGLIYNSADTLQQLSRYPNFRYQRGLTLDSVREHADRVVLNCRTESQSSSSIDAQRVFLAAGVLNTARVALSEGWVPGHQLTLSDSQYFLLPLLSFSRPAEDFQADLHTLSQMFLEILDPQISPYTIHLQLYTFSELFRESFLATAGPLKSVAKLFSKPFLSRLIMVQGYLHSSQSHRIRAELHNDSNRTLQLSQIHNPEMRPTIHRLCRKLWSARRQLGFIPLEPMIKYGLAGRGYHVGSSIPMAATPQPGTSDVLGRPHGLNRIHIVDASVLPTIPATTITFTVMANAHRIGTDAARL